MTTKHPQVKLPETVVPGEVVLIRTKAWHPMETGWRKGPDGKEVPRDRIHLFLCSFEGAQVLRAEFHSGVSANPYLAFHARVPSSGTFRFEWHADDGTVFVKTASVTALGV